MAISSIEPKKPWLQFNGFHSLTLKISISKFIFFSVLSGNAIEAGDGVSEERHLRWVESE
jgi:hypothetical protein